MLRQTKVAVSFVLVAFLLIMDGTPGANDLSQPCFDPGPGCLIVGLG